MSGTVITLEPMSVTVNSGILMGRWEPNSRGRLQEAALALFAERASTRPPPRDRGASWVDRAHVLPVFRRQTGGPLRGAGILEERICPAWSGHRRLLALSKRLSLGLDSAAEMLAKPVGTWPAIARP